MFSGKLKEEKVLYCERFVEFLIDVEAQLPTRRFFNALMDDSHIVTISQLSNLAKRDEGQLFTEVSFTLRPKLKFYLFPLTRATLKKKAPSQKNLFKFSVNFFF